MEKMIEALERHTIVSYTKDEKKNLWTAYYAQRGLKTLQK